MGAAGAEPSAVLSEGNLEPKPTVASAAAPAGARLEATIVESAAVEADCVASEDGDCCAKTTPIIAAQLKPAIAQAVVTRRMGKPPDP
jgi:hypothetical protein